jgi:hypothetical protein
MPKHGRIRGASNYLITYGLACTQGGAGANPVTMIAWIIVTLVSSFFAKVFLRLPGPYRRHELQRDQL